MKTTMFLLTLSSVLIFNLNPCLSDCTDEGIQNCYTFSPCYGKIGPCGKDKCSQECADCLKECCARYGCNDCPVDASCSKKVIKESKKPH